MNQSEIRGRLIVVGVVVLLSVYFLLGTARFGLFSLSNPFPSNPADVPAWEKERNALLRHSIRPGLDLMGGVDVLLSIDQSKVATGRVEELRKLLRRGFGDSSIPGTIELDAKNVALAVTVTDSAMHREALAKIKAANANEEFEAFDEAEFLKSGKTTLKFHPAASTRETHEAVQRTRDLLRERVDSLGLVQPSVATQGDNQIRIQLPGETNPRETVERVVAPAHLEFRLVHPDYLTLTGSDGKLTPEGKRIVETDPNWVARSGKIGRESDAGEMTYSEPEFILAAEPSIEGSDVANAYPTTGNVGWEIGLEFERAGVQKMADLTRDNRGRQMAILLDDVVRSAPRINEPITDGRCRITGSFTPAEASQLSRVINTGALPVRLRTESSRVIGAKLGTDAIKGAVKALALGSALVLAFMAAYYSGSGLIAIGALAVNVLVILSLLAAWGATLTLSGIAGILLTIGMAVDANVLIYERIREELKAGKRAADAIAAGFDNAFSTIVDANMTTLITALILLQFGKGSVQGFALTMTFGIFATLFTGLYVSRAFFGGFERANKAPMGTMNIFANPKYDFLGMRKIGFGISAVVILLGLGSIGMHGGLILGADFSGGVIAEVSVPASESTGTIRKAIADADSALKSVDVVKVHNADSYLVKTKLLAAGDDAVEKTTAQLEGAMAKAYPSGLEILGTDTIGNEVSGDFAHRAIIAFLLSCAAILVYVAIRFESRFGWAAVIALVHDVLVTLGVITFLDMEITLDVVAALLVVVGYSINDTIVIFDRIREDLATHLKSDFDTVANLAINECLNRSIITSGTTIFSVLALLLVAGQGLHDFAMTLFVGMIAGCYSSTFVATPLLSWFIARAHAKEA